MPAHQSSFGFPFSANLSISQLCQITSAWPKWPRCFFNRSISALQLKRCELVAGKLPVPNMTEPSRDRLIVLNAFVHDVATGTWLATLVLLTMLESEAGRPEWAPAAGLVSTLARKLMVLTWASLGTIAATGVVRLATFRAFGWTGDVAKDRLQLLKVKHALLGTAFLAGTAYMAWIAYQ